MRRLTTIQCLLGNVAAYPELSTVLLTCPAAKMIRLTDSTPRWVLPSKVSSLVVTPNRLGPNRDTPQRDLLSLPSAQVLGVRSRWLCGTLGG